MFCSSISENTVSTFIDKEGGILVGSKDPAGAHAVAPNLDNTDSVYVKHRNTNSVYVIDRNLCLRHGQCV